MSTHDALAVDVRRGERAAAVRDILAVTPGIVPFGITLGVTAAAGGTGLAQGLIGSLLVYGGSAQLTTVTLLQAGAGALLAVASGVLVNLRLLLYGAALEPRFRNQPRWFRLLGPHLIIDQTYLAAAERPSYAGPDFRRYWCWLGGLLALAWLSAVGTGLALGPFLPDLPSLWLVGTALFIGMLAPRLADRPSMAGAAAAAAAAALLAPVSPGIGLVAGAVAGMAVLAEGRRDG